MADGGPPSPWHRACL